MEEGLNSRKRERFPANTIRVSKKCLCFRSWWGFLEHSFVSLCVILNITFFLIGSSLPTIMGKTDKAFTLAASAGHTHRSDKIITTIITLGVSYKTAYLCSLKLTSSSSFQGFLPASQGVRETQRWRTGWGTNTVKSLVRIISRSLWALGNGCRCRLEILHFIPDIITQVKPSDRLLRKSVKERHSKVGIPTSKLLENQYTTNLKVKIAVRPLPLFGMKR